MTKKTLGPKVSENYLQNPIANLQGCDEPYDPAFKERFQDGQILNGRGSQGGGSKPTPQTTRMRAADGRLHGSYPKHPQKLRG